MVYPIDPKKTWLILYLPMIFEYLWYLCLFLLGDKYCSDPSQSVDVQGWSVWIDEFLHCQRTDVDVEIIQVNMRITNNSVFVVYIQLHSADVKKHINQKRSMCRDCWLNCLLQRQFFATWDPEWLAIKKTANVDWVIPGWPYVAVSTWPRWCNWGPCNNQIVLILH